MLILTRRAGESLFIGEGIEVTVLRIKGNQIRLGINAPGSVGVRRAELSRLEAENLPAFARNSTAG